jgi:hypothetical protein
MFLISKLWEGKYNMRTMMFITIVTLLTMQMAKSDEKYQMCKDKETWFEKNWCETVEFQKQGWEQGKKDLAKTKVDLQNLPANTIMFVKETPTNVSNFVKDTSNGVSNWATSEWNSIKEYQKKSWSK